jgi:hypothetical protein
MIGSLGSKKDFTCKISSFSLCHPLITLKDETISFILWFTIENYVTIITASIPALRPLSMHITGKRRTNRSGYPYNNSYEMGGRSGGISANRARHGYLRRSDGVMEIDSKEWPNASQHSKSDTIKSDKFKMALGTDRDASSEEIILEAAEIPFGSTVGAPARTGRDHSIKKTTTVTLKYSGSDGNSVDAIPEWPASHSDRRYD